VVSSTLEQLAALTKAGHPDSALVGVPVSMIREIERDLRRGNNALDQLAALQERARNGGCQDQVG
jgi:hypothetical protein